MANPLSPINLSGAGQALGGTIGLLSDFAGKDPALWDIIEGSFLSDTSKAKGLAPMIFHVFSSKVNNYQGAVPRISDKGGRRKVKYAYPYLDGQTTDDLGRKAGEHNFEIMLFGLNYKTALNNLMVELDQPGPGTLNHPVLGAVRCVMEDFEMLHQCEARKAVLIHLSLTEHNYSIGQIAQQFKPINDVKSGLANALAALKQISAVIDKVSAYQLFARSFILQVNNLLGAYQTAFGTQLQNINTTFNNGSSTDLPSLLPVNQGGNGSAPGSTAAFPTAVTQADAFSGVSLPVSSSTTLPVSAVQAAVDSVNAVRDQCEVVIELIESGNGGLAALDFYDEILGLKQGAVNLQVALEAGIASSNAQLVPYTVPRIMSIREVCFANGLTPDDSNTVELLNPSILSFNMIPAGTVVMVPAQ